MEVHKMSLNQQLIESGERDRLKELLRQRLLDEGWHGEVKQLCKEVVREVGVDNVTAEDMISRVTPEARRRVPDNVKRELLQHIKSFLAQKTGLSDL